MGERNTSGSFEARDGRYGDLPDMKTKRVHAHCSECGAPCRLSDDGNGGHDEGVLYWARTCKCGEEPTWCDSCGEAITDDQDMVSSMVEECSIETGPTGTLVQSVRHASCRP